MNSSVNFSILASLFIGYCYLFLLVDGADQKAKRPSSSPNMANNKEDNSTKSLEGEETTLECQMVKERQKDSFVVTKLEWTKNGAVVASYSKRAESAEWWVSEPRLILDRGVFSLTISPTFHGDRGMYACSAQFQSKGKQTSVKPPSINLEVIGPPSPPGRPLVASYTSRSATLTWDRSMSHEKAPVLQYHVYASIGRESNSMNVYKEVGTTGGDVTSLLVSGLHPHTVYTFSVSSENIAGRSANSPSSFPVRMKGEAPVASPKIKYVYNATNTSVVLTWDHPPAHSLHGPLVGYRIIVRQVRGKERSEFYISKPDITSFEITGLNVYTKYIVSLEADNNFGYSPPDTVQILTAEGVPASAPIITNLAGLSSNSIEVTWLPPNVTNGLLTHYTLCWSPTVVATRRRRRRHALYRRHVRFASKVTSADVGSKFLRNIQVNQNSRSAVVKYVLDGLVPYTRYSVWLTASTSQGSSPSSDLATVYTDTAGVSRNPRYIGETAWRHQFGVAPLSFLRVREITPNLIAPNEPRIVNLTVRSTDVALVEWHQPVSVYRRVDFYMVAVEGGRNGNPFEADHAKILNTSDTNIFLTGLEPSVRYLLNVRAVTQSVIESDRYYIGRPSPSEAFTLKVSPTDGLIVVLHTSVCPPGTNGPRLNHNHLLSTVFCDIALKSNQTYSTNNFEASNFSMVTVAVLGSLGLLILIVLFVLIFLLLWKRYFAAKQYKLEGFTTVASTFEEESFDDIDAPAIPIDLFADHVKMLRADGCAGFSKEYETIENQSPTGNDGLSKVTYENSLLPENKPKNRYVNIVAYDHTRVTLRNLPGRKRSDYINANFVDGFRHARAYIATQGPLPNTYGDFWRMIWEQRCSVIVMITNIIERGRKKCDQYWPTEGDENYDGFIVRLLNEYVTAFYTVRMLTIKNNKTITRGAERYVIQYHYTHWPDHGVPDCPSSVLSFVRKSAAANRDNAPIVVHCSAGVGRSGTYMVIDSMLRQMKAKTSINVFAYLRHIRQQRNFLVQTEEQYAFCHEALLEFIEAGETEIGNADLHNYVANVLPKVSLHLQYQLITRHSEKCSFLEARKIVNQTKNRSINLIPVDGYRVTVTPKPGEPGTDYINATFFPGFHRSEEFIVTQFPTAHTSNDFWQMVWDHNCQTIVLLSSCDEVSWKKFWPDSSDTSFQLDTFQVFLTEQTKNNSWYCVDLILQSKDDDFQLPCRLLQYPTWPDVCPSLANVWQLVHWVQEWHLAYHNGPTVVVDRYGGRESALFCCLTSLSCQMDQDSSVDIYQFAKLCWMRRPGVFPTCDDYNFLYQCVDALLGIEMDVSESSSLNNNNNNGMDGQYKSLKSSKSAPLDLRSPTNHSSIVAPPFLPVDTNLNNISHLGRDTTL